MNIEKLRKLFPKNLKVSESKVTMGDGEFVIVHTIKNNQKLKKDYPPMPVLFLPGFIGSTSQWVEVLSEIASNGHTIYSFETREKSSSSSGTKVSRFSTEGLMLDLLDILNYLQLSKPFALMGVSLGSTISMKHAIDNTNEDLTPKVLVLLDAVYISTPLDRLIRLAKIKPLFMLVMRFVRVFAPIIFYRRRKRNYFSYKKFVDSLRNADLEKMRVGLIISTTMKVQDGLPSISIPSLVIAVRDDATHPFEQASYIADKMKDARLVDMQTDELLHSKITAEFICNFLGEHSKKDP